MCFFHRADPEEMLLMMILYVPESSFCQRKHWPLSALRSGSKSSVI